LKALSIGVKVKDTKAEINTAALLLLKLSEESTNENLLRKITGKNTAASVTEIEITAKKISFDPLIALRWGSCHLF
jgi:hypothetical protein